MQRRRTESTLLINITYIQKRKDVVTCHLSEKLFLFLQFQETLLRKLTAAGVKLLLLALDGNPSKGFYCKTSRLEKTPIICGCFDDQ